MVCKLKNSKRGVALIFFAMVFGLSLGFLMIILNTGLLVYQKMRLQSAVDLAAYAGASVQSAYLGNEASGYDSIKSINVEIMQRYMQLIEDINTKPNRGVPPVMMIPDLAACMALCQANNLVVAQKAIDIYRSAQTDIDELQEKARRILEQLPEAAREAAEETLRRNIPEFSTEGNGLGSVITKVDDVLSPSASVFSKKKNVMLNFASTKGMYLANVVANVPHRTIYFGPACFPAAPGHRYNEEWFCTVNGAGAGAGRTAQFAMMAAYSRGVLGGEFSGNIGQIERIGKEDAHAIKLHFVENLLKPKPFFVSSAEWYPVQGTYANLENSLGANGNLLPKSVRLGAVAAAEPFGSSLFTQNSLPFGVKLQGIRKVLLDPRMQGVKDDFPGLFPYMRTLGPKDEKGNPTETAEETIRRFLH